MTGPTRGIFVFFLAAFLCCCRSQDIWNKTIYVATNGTDSVDCGKILRPCATLDFAIRSASNSTRIQLEPGIYSLNTSFSFTRISDFAIVGIQDVEVRCRANVSLAFVLSSNIVLQGIKFRKCGGWHQSMVVYENYHLVSFISALYFNYCKNLRVSHVQVSGTSGVGLTLYNVGGVVNISESVFSENRSPEVNLSSPRTARSGGGVFLGLGPAASNPVNVTPSEHALYVSNNVYLLQKCNFTANRAPMPGFKGEHELPNLPFTRGGGAAIYVAGNSSNNTFGISSCHFQWNTAVWGGGLQVQFQGRSQNNSMSIQGTLFDSNVAGLAGGGARVGTLIKVDDRLLYNDFYFTNCVFQNNSAQWGGGVAVYGTTRPAPQARGHVGKVAAFQECRWWRNQGLVGSAIGAFLVNLNEDDIGPRVPFHLELDNCSITENNVTESQDDVEVGQGAVYTVEVPVILKNNTTISNNTKTAMVLDSATLEVHDQVHFLGNTGFRGGALALFGRSKIVLMKNSSLVFIENMAEEKGGAMYVNAPGSPLVNFNSAGIDVHACFLAYGEERDVDYSDWQTEVVFRGNTAPSASGKSLYATTLKNCIRGGETRRNNTALQWRIIKFQDKDANTTDEIVTDPIDILLEREEWRVAPSQSFNASVKLIDEKGHHVYGIVNINVHGSPDTRLATRSSLFLATNNQVTYIKMNGKGGEMFNVSVRTVGVQLVSTEMQNISFKQCNPGFRPQNSQCVCASDVLDGVSRCKGDGLHFYLRSGYWAGKLADGQFVTYPCPEYYCKRHKRSNLTNEYLYVKGEMCADHREGILCGKCEWGYTVLIGSEKCVNDCSDLYLLTLIPYAVVLLGVVMLIMLINLDVFTGYLNAWLYSYQVMPLIAVSEFDPFIVFIIGLANAQLKYGGSCLMKNIDDSDKLALLYVLPTYILLVVFILARVVRAYPNWCYSRRVKAPFRAFCTLFVLCYTVITSITLKILHPAVLHHKVVLFQDGEVDFFKGKHIGYGILAIVYLLVVVIPFPLTLMFTPFFTKCLFPVFNLNNFRPVYDAFQSCFKDEYRWCSAFYFVARLYLMVFAIYLPSSYLKRILLESTCMFVLTVFVYLRPYKVQHDWLNKLDAVLLTNLALIAIFRLVALELPGTPVRHQLNCL